MTNQTLGRGQDIQYEIDHLKKAIMQLNDSKFFNESCRSNMCFGDNLNPFLSTLHTEIKTYAVKQITDRIAVLEKEFNAL